MQVSIVTIHPQFVTQYLTFGCLKSAQMQNLVRTEVLDLRSFAVDRHGSVDDRPYGGGDGMVLRPEPLQRAVEAVGPADAIILPSPRGERWNASLAKKWSTFTGKMVLICGRFAGVDERFVNRYVDYEYSLGDFIVSGGELPALMMLESIARFIPGVLGNAMSASRDSFEKSMGGGLEYPLYTRPKVFAGLEVPKVLLSGDQKKITDWRSDAARKMTGKKRPDLQKSSSR